VLRIPLALARLKRVVHPLQSGVIRRKTTDLALSLIAEEYGADLDLFNATRSARQAADRVLTRSENRNRADHRIDSVPCPTDARIASGGS